MKLCRLYFSFLGSIIPCTKVELGQTINNKRVYGKEGDGEGLSARPKAVLAMVTEPSR